MFARVALATLLLAPLTTMQTPGKRIITTGPTPSAPFSPAVAAGGLIYVSGTLPQDASGAVVGKGDIRAQTRQVLTRVRELLAAAGSSLEQVVSVTIYLKSVDDFQAMNDAYRTFWSAALPTRTTVITDLLLPDALVEMSMIAVPAGAERTVIQPEGWLKSPNPYSYAIRTGDTLFLSGLVPRNARDNTSVPGDVSTQTRTIMDNAGVLLKAAGMTYDNVVSARVYLPDVSTFPAMTETYGRYFTGAPPARATVKAGLVSGQAGVEITMIASSSPRVVVDDGRAPTKNVSVGIQAGRRVYLAGMLGHTDGQDADAAEQTGNTLARIRRVLAAAGCTPADVVDGIVYLSDLRAYAAMNDAYRAFFERSFPARATVGTGLVPAGAIVEIMMTAVRP